MNKKIENAKASKDQQLVNLNDLSSNCLKGFNFFKLKSWENTDFQADSCPKELCTW